jgi:hypothetical protein
MEPLNELIALASVILDRGFDLQAFLSWKQTSFLALLTLLGPFHFYTLNFRRMAEPSERGLLSGEGILVAANELLQSERSPFTTNHTVRKTGHAVVVPRDLSPRMNH